MTRKIKRGGGLGKSPIGKEYVQAAKDIKNLYENESNFLTQRTLGDSLIQLTLKAILADNITLQLINEVDDDISDDLKIKILNAAAKYGIALFEKDKKKMKEELDKLLRLTNNGILLDSRIIMNKINEAIRSAKIPTSRSEPKTDVPLGLTAREAGLPRLTERMAHFEIGSTSRAGPSTVARPDPKSLSGKLFAFDFDETILKIHAFKKYKIFIPRNGIISEQILRDINLDIDETHFADLVFFKRFISDIINKGGRIAIVSFGIKEIIQLYINKYLSDFISNIEIYANKGVSDTKNYKNNLLKKAWLHKGDDVDDKTLNETYLNKDNIFFADDDTANIKHAFDKATTFQCKDHKKVTTEEWNALLKGNKEIGFTKYTWEKWLNSNNNSKLPIIKALGPPFVPASGGRKRRKLKANKK